MIELTPGAKVSLSYQDSCMEIELGSSRPLVPVQQSHALNSKPYTLHPKP